MKTPNLHKIKYDLQGHCRSLKNTFMYVEVADLFHLLTWEQLWPTLLWIFLKLCTHEFYNLGEEGVAHGIIQTNSKVVVASEELIPRKSLFTFCLYQYGLIEIICTMMKNAKGIYWKVKKR